MRGLAQYKADARRVLHERAAVSAFYSDDVVDNVEITVRWHTKLTLAGRAPDGFDAAIIEGINRLVFQEPELTSEGRVARGLPPLPDDLDSIELQREGKVTVPDYQIEFELDSMEEPDGPLNIYWNVVTVR